MAVDLSLKLTKFENKCLCDIILLFKEQIYPQLFSPTQHKMVTAALLVIPERLNLSGKEFCLVPTDEALEKHLLLTSLL